MDRLQNRLARQPIASEWQGMGSEEPKAIGQGGCAALPLPAPEAIRTQLGSILASPEFQLPERGRAFLR